MFNHSDLITVLLQIPQGIGVFISADGTPISNVSSLMVHVEFHFVFVAILILVMVLVAVFVDSWTKRWT